MHIQQHTHNNTADAGSITWKSPSNIALVKYWGKHGNQLPSNPSISFTLSESFTQSTLEYTKKETPGTIDITVVIDGVEDKKFGQKSLVFLANIQHELPFITQYSFTLKTHNSFPHSSGIASSASGMSALALCLLSLEAVLFGAIETNAFLARASYFARIGSGSASRSVYGGLVVWGRLAEIVGSDDDFAIPYPFEIHNDFKSYNDTILLVHEGAKSISSSLGHMSMSRHPFAPARYQEARTHISQLIPILRSGELDEFGQIVEKEALMLHALMMSAEQPFILIKPNTLAIIEKIWDYRKQNNVPVYFTLDAGANVHVLYPNNVKDTVLPFIENELAMYCENKKYICDLVGEGPEFING